MSNTMPKFLQVIQLGTKLQELNLGDNIETIAPADSVLVVLFKDGDRLIFDPASLRCMTPSALVKKGVPMKDAVAMIQLLEETYGKIDPVRTGLSEEAEAIERHMDMMNSELASRIKEAVKTPEGEAMMETLSSAFQSYLATGEVTDEDVVKIKEGVAQMMGDIAPTEEQEEAYEKHEAFTEDRTGLKDKLRTGYILINRQGDQHTVFMGTERGNMIVRDHDNKAGFKHATLNQFNDDMTARFDASKDVVEVYAIKDFYSKTEEPKLLFKEAEESSEEAKLKKEIAEMQRALSEKQRNLEKMKNN